IADLADTDLDGNPRFADDPATPDTGCGMPVVVDMGAYEYQGEPARVVLGDIDGNGRVGIRDLVTLMQCMGSDDPKCCVADLDLDGEVGMSDVMLLIQMLVHSVPFEP
ncbi:MAG: dockerin type I domain-containing protein, partial [Planctomycetota bacterium]